MDKLLGILFLCNMLWFFVNILLMKKSNEKQNIFVWTTISIALVSCVNAIIALLYHILSVNINIISIGVIVLAINITLTFYMVKTKNIQKFEVKLFDGVVLLFILLLSIYFSTIQFGEKFMSLNFETSDPSVHLKNAMNVVFTGKIVSIYLTALNEGLILQSIIPFMSNLLSCYRVYILFEVAMFAYTGMVLYTVTHRSVKTWISKVSFLFILFIYLISYPMNSMVFGYGYLSFGVSICGLIIVNTNMMMKKEYNNFIKISLMMLLYGIMITYIQFAPVVYVASALTVLVSYWRKKQLFEKKTIVTCVLIYIVPGLIGTLYALNNIFGVHSAESILAIDGYAFKDWFAGFILYVPMAMTCVLKGIKNKDDNMIISINIISFVYIVGMFLLGMEKKVSAYYYFKNYYLESFILATSIVFAIAYLVENSKEIVISYIFTWAVLFGIYVSEIEKHMVDYHLNFNNTIVAEKFFLVYDYNKEKARTDGFEQGKLEMIHFINDLSDDKKCVMASNWQDCYWFEALTKHRTLDYTYHTAMSQEKNYVEILDEMDYIVVNTKSEAYLNNQEFFDAQERVFSNTAGFIIKMN